jgi:hypothetical protein
MSLFGVTGLQCVVASSQAAEFDVICTAGKGFAKVAVNLVGTRNFPSDLIRSPLASYKNV